MASFTKEQNGTWSVRFRTIVDGKEVRKRMRGFESKKAAQIAYAEYLQDEEKEQKVKEDPNQMLFDDLMNKYIDYIKQRTKESSSYTKESRIRNRVMPTFTGKKLCDISVLDILEFTNDLSKNYSSEYAIACYSCLRAMYKFGSKYYKIDDTMKDCDRPKKEKTEKKSLSVWSSDEFSEFMKVVDDDVYYTLFMTLYFTGARRGEVQALEWSDIDLQKNKISISKTYTQKTNEGNYKITSPKTYESNRTISIPQILSDRLSVFKVITEYTGPYVFGGERPLASSTIDHRFGKYIEKANVKPIRIHDLRHSFASLMISNGASVVLLAKHLGHSDIKMTLNTYSHFFPDEEDRVISSINKIKL